MSEPALAAVKQLFNTTEPAGLGPERRDGTQSAATINTKLDELLSRTAVSAANQQLVRALMLLWHDHLDEAHGISQEIENPDGSFVHAIMHRREPDYWNSKYWFRRVGAHPTFQEIAKRVSELLKESRAGELTGELLPGGKWDAFAFVDACEDTAGGGSTELPELLRAVQRIEFEVLLERFLSGSPL